MKPKGCCTFGHCHFEQYSVALSLSDVPSEIWTYTPQSVPKQSYTEETNGQNNNDKSLEVYKYAVIPFLYTIAISLHTYVYVPNNNVKASLTVLSKESTNSFDKSHIPFSR